MFSETARSVELLESPIFLPSAYLAHLTDPVVCRAAGRSMAPVILPGDYAVIDRAERNRLEINSRDIYLVDAAELGEEVALTLKHLSLSRGCLRLKPLNTQEYVETEIDIDGTPLLSIVLGVVVLVVRDKREVIPEK